LPLNRRCRRIKPNENAPYRLNHAIDDGRKDGSSEEGVIGHLKWRHVKKL
jgi:hypothetical protein